MTEPGTPDDGQYLRRGLGAVALSAVLPAVPQWLWIVAFVLFNTAVNLRGIRTNPPSRSAVARTARPGRRARSSTPPSSPRR